MIDFEIEDVVIPEFDKRMVCRWLKSVAADYGFTIGNLHYVFCDDEKILDVNRKFLQHDYYTDVITFDYSAGDMVSGDIFISIDTVRSNAEREDETFVAELMRIIVHGLLHLTGQGDKTPESKAEMTRKENLALAKLA